jgi:hypothetical protein
MVVTQSVLSQFNLTGEPVPLPGGEGRTFKVGSVVLKHIKNDTVDYLNWIADLYANAQEDGFRIPKPIANIQGSWITEDGWSAWQFLEGNHVYIDRIPQSIEAINAFHRSIKNVSKPDFLEIDSAYTRADRSTWGNLPANIHPELQSLVESLYEVRKSVEGLEDQIIHGDLNPDNILISDTLPPAIIDIAPYWHPPEFSLAVYAYWISAYKDEPELLDNFKDVKEFNQMLVRAGIRMLLIMSEFNKVSELDKYNRATEIILQRISSK